MSTLQAERLRLLISTLKGRYSPTPVPPCRVCGEKLSIQAVGGGRPTVWACAGLEPDPQTAGRYYREGRSCADQHFADSRWEDYRSGGDSEVIELIDAMEGMLKTVGSDG